MNRATLSVQDVLREARDDGLRLRADGDRLVVNGDPAMREKWRPMLVEMKSAILSALADAANSDAAAMPERAAGSLPPAIDVRLAKLVAGGAIDADDASLCKSRYSTAPAAWDCLLDACEAAAATLGAPPRATD